MSDGPVPASGLKRALYLAIVSLRSLRARVYTGWLRCFFGRIGQYSLLQPPVHFKDPYKILLGRECSIRSGVRFNGRSSEAIGIRIGDGVSVRESSYIDAYGGSIHLDDYCSIGHRCVLGGHGGLYVGRYTMIGGLTYVIPSNHVFDGAELPYMLQGETRKGIHIGNNVWIGAGCVILDGVVIGDNAVIGAGSVVTRSIPPGVVAVGVPARPRRTIGDPQS